MPTPCWTGYYRVIDRFKRVFTLAFVFMRRLGLFAADLLLLAACSSAPQRLSRSRRLVVGVQWRVSRTPPGFPNFVDHSVGREEISIQAMSLVGIPYRWGGNTPESGFDCSGFVRYVVARAASVNLPRTTADMSDRGESIEPDEVAPGDLIFFNTTGRAAFARRHLCRQVALRQCAIDRRDGAARLPHESVLGQTFRRHPPRGRAHPAPAPFETPTYQASTPPVQTAPAVAQGSYAGAAIVPAEPVAQTQTAYGNAAPAGVSVEQRSQQQPQRVATTTQTPLTAAQPVAAAAAAAPAAPADAFEPPPSAMSAAQMQAREAGAVAPENVPSERVQSSEGAMATSGNAPVQAATPSNIARAPDPIDAAADAFEPPPPASVAVRQEQQAGSSGGVQIMRASTASHGVPAPTQSSDDPIAHFANGSY